MSVVEQYARLYTEVYTGGHFFEKEAMDVADMHLKEMAAKEEGNRKAAHAVAAIAKKAKGALMLGAIGIPAAAVTAGVIGHKMGQARMKRENERSALKGFAAGTATGLAAPSVLRYAAGSQGFANGMGSFV